jgi:hypothetical protein
MQESKLAQVADITDFLDLSKDLTDEQGRYGVINRLAVGGETIEEMYMKAMLLGRKIATKWQKKRLLQIGMFEDTLRVLGVCEAYNIALREELQSLRDQIKRHEAARSPEQATPVPEQVA